jgi:hypothetical protein
MSFLVLSAGTLRFTTRLENIGLIAMQYRKLPKISRSTFAPYREGFGFAG